MGKLKRVKQERIKCPKCNTVYGTGDLFCSKCGFQLKEQKERDISKEVTKGIIQKELKSTKSQFMFLGLIILSILLAVKVHVIVGIIVFIIGFIYQWKWYYG